MIFDSLITRIKERFDLVNKNRPRGITFYKLSKTLQILFKIFLMSNKSKQSLTLSELI